MSIKLKFFNDVLYSRQITDQNITDSVAPTAPQRVGDTVESLQISEQVQNQIEINAVEQSIADSARIQQVGNAIRQATQQDRAARIARSKPTDTVESAIAHFPIRSDSVPQIMLFDESLNTDTLSTALIDTSMVAEPHSKMGMSAYTLDGQKDGMELPMKLNHSDGIFALLMISFLFVSLLFQGGTEFVRNNLILVFSHEKSHKMADQQTTLREAIGLSFLVFLSVLLISISLYVGLDRFMPLEGINEQQPFITISLFVGAILLFFFIKLIFNRFVGYVCDMQKFAGALNHSYVILLGLLGLFSFVPTLLLVYSEFGHGIMVGIVLLLLILVQLILIVRLIVFFIKIKTNILIMIAYLCSIEIIPYIFLTIGLVYIYKIDVFNTIL